MENKYEMELHFNDNFKNEDGVIVETLYTTIPELTDIQYYLEELQEIELFDLNDITQIRVYPLQNERCSVITPTNNKQLNEVYTLHDVNTMSNR